MLRVLGLPVLLLLGLLTGAAGVAVHQRWWGLALVLATVPAVVVALPAGWWTRLPFAVGFGAVLGFAMTPRPEGDYLVPGNGRGYTLLGLGLAVLLVAIATLPRPGSRT